MDEQDGWEEITVRKTTAVVKCRICEYVGKNEDYGDQRLNTKVLLHCPGCNKPTWHSVMERILEVSGLSEPQVDIDAIVDTVSKAVMKQLKMKETV